MGFSSGFLTPDSLRTDVDGYAVAVQLPWMRSIPFNSITGFSVTLDGVTSEPNDLTFVINGSERSLSDMVELWDSFWFIQTPLTVRVRSVRSLVAGDVATVTVRATLRLPYLLVGPGAQPMVVQPEMTRELVAS